MHQPSKTLAPFYMTELRTLHAGTPVLFVFQDLRHLIFACELNKTKNTDASLTFTDVSDDGYLSIFELTKTDLGREQGLGLPTLKASTFAVRAETTHCRQDTPTWEKNTLAVPDNKSDWPRE